MRRRDVNVDVDAVTGVSTKASVRRLLLFRARAVTAIRVGLPLFLTFSTVSILLQGLVVNFAAPVLKPRILLRQPVVDFCAELVVLGKCRHLGSELLNEKRKCGFNGHLQGLLNHIVAILIGKKLNKVVCLHDFCDHQCLDVIACLLKALLNHVRRKLLAAQSEETAKQL